MEIVKPLKGPNEEEVYNDNFEVKEDSLEEKVIEEPKGFKKLYLIVVLMLVAILGYFGLNFLQKNETSQANIETIVASPTNNQNSSDAKEVEAKDLSTMASVAPAVKQVEEETATPTTQETQAKDNTDTTIASVMPKVEKAQEAIPPVATESTKEKILVKETAQESIKQESIKQENTKQEAPKEEKVALTQEKTVEKTEPKPSQTEALDIKLTQVKLVETPKPVIEKPSIKKPEIEKPKVVKAKPPKAPTNKAKVVKKKTPNKKPRIVTVKKGDTLALIAKKYYGNAMEFKHIVRANQKIKSHKTPLKLGQKLLVPYVGTTKSVKKTTPRKKPRIVTVKKGYSLAYISKKYYGNINQVKRIVAANPKIKNQNATLKIGQKIHVPR